MSRDRRPSSKQTFGDRWEPELCKHCGAEGYSHHLWCPLLVRAALAGLAGVATATIVFVATSVFTEQSYDFGGLVIGWIVVLVLCFAVMLGRRNRPKV